MIFCNIISENFRVKSLRNFRKRRSDISSSNHTDRLLIKIKSHQTIQSKILLANAVVSFVRFSVKCQNHCHCVFRYSFRRISGNSANAQSQTFCCFQIHIVETGTTQRYIFHAFLRERFQNFRVQLVIHECANSIGMIDDIQNVWTEMRFEIIEFKVEILIDFVKEFLVVRFGGEKGDFHILKVQNSSGKINF
ncbi:hypothetical protein D3C86_1385840 [compost metagenome]